MRFDDIDGDVVEDPGKVEAIGRVLKNVGLGGFGEEAQAAMESVGRLGVVGFGDSPSELAQRWKSILSGGAGGLPSDSEKQNLTYSQRRNAARAVDDVTHDEHRMLSNVVGFGVGLIHPLNKVGGKGLIGAMKGGALQGAVQGLGDSRADLTDGDIENYARAFQDTSNGANYGAAFGAAGHGLGVAARGVGRKVGGIIDSARESLFREEAERGARELADADAPRIAQREAEVAARAKEQARLDREHGQGLEMNKAADRRAAKEAERAAQRASRQPRGEAPALTEEPGTRTLGGYKGSAGERRAVNFDRVQAYRERLADPNLGEAERGRLQQYIDAYGDAVDNPGAFERRRIEQELRKRYPSDMVDRIMAERVGPDGAIRSRQRMATPEASGAPAEPLAPEPLTEPGRPDFSDYEVPYDSPMFRENLAREVEREGLDAPHWQRSREPGERPLTPYENAQLEAQNRRMAPDEDTVPQYGYPPEEQFRYQQRLPEDLDFQVGDAAPAERPPVLASMPARRAAGEGMFDFSNKAPRAVHNAPTRGGGGAEPAPIPELDPLDVSLSPPREPTAAASPRAMQRPPPEAPALAAPDVALDKTPVQRPSWMPPAPEPGKAPLYGSKPPTDEEVVYKYLGSLESPAMQRAQAREAGAFGELARKGGKAMLDADNPFSAAMRGPWAVTREAIRNPAVRARALSALRLRRLASVDPETWGRVGRALEQALQQGPEEYAAVVHVYNQTDPGFREAQRKASEGLEGMDDARLEQELRAAGLL